MTFPQAALYLQIPASYCRSIGGLRWAHYGEAVEFLEGPAAGLTFAFAPEIALFLEGFRGVDGGVPAFGHVLHLLYLIGLGDRAAADASRPGNCLKRIASRFRAEGCPLRNAGALCAAISAEAPRAADAPELAAMHAILTDGNWVPSVVLAQSLPLAMNAAEEPGLDPEQFEALVSRRLETMSDAEIRHWLRHGRGAVDQGVERLVPERPRSVVDVFSTMERRPRLAGTRALAARLEAVLWLPSRRLERPELQGGGYSDITTRGAPERILPIQLAFDGEEFIRRFAEGELLYFHREEPRETVTDELILLLDQGVRTWGNVRLVLCSAAVALSRQAERRRIAVKLATTGSDGGPVDLKSIDSAALSSLIEASDLSLHPGAAIQRLLASAREGRRDLVVLTHPLNLNEPEVIAAAQAVSGAGYAETRLFAVAVDSKGRLELAELRRGLPVVLARSKVEIGPEVEPVPASPKMESVAPQQAPLRFWKGDFEPIGFPFRCGLLDRLERPDATRGNARAQAFDFDESGERILAVGAGLGPLLFTSSLDGAECEHLPTPVHAGKPLLMDQKVIGVAGGFVVVGHSHRGACLAHYDFPSRRCVIHGLGRFMPSASWSYFRDLHAIVIKPREKDARYLAFDLSATGPDAESTIRARCALEREQQQEQLFMILAQPGRTWERNASTDLGDRLLGLDPDSGVLRFRIAPSHSEQSALPLADGKPALKGGQIVRARRGGDVLAVLVHSGASPGLYFISVSRCAVIGMFQSDRQLAAGAFALSRDGRRFAVLSGTGDLEVRDVLGEGTPVFVTPREEVAVHFLSLGRSCVLVREVGEASRHVHDRCLIRWDRGRLEVERDDVFSVFSRLGGVLTQSRSLRRGDAEVNGHQLRFVGIIEEGSLRILIDRYNHFVVLDARGSLVCIFYVIGNEVAALLVDGTYWGSRRLTGREPAPGAAERIGRALLEAEGGAFSDRG
jgi:hypothetical protein